MLDLTDAIMQIRAEKSEKLKSEIKNNKNDRKGKNDLQCDQMPCRKHRLGAKRVKGYKKCSLSLGSRKEVITYPYLIK